MRKSRAAFRTVATAPSVWIEPDESSTSVTFNGRHATGRSGFGTTFSTPLVVTLAVSVSPPPDTVNEFVMLAFAARFTRATIVQI